MYQNLIQTVTVGSGGAASIDFTSIPATFTDLFIVISPRATSSTATMTMTINNASTFSTARFLASNGSSVTSSTDTNFIGNAPTSSYAASTFGNVGIYFPNYAGSTTKTFYVDAVADNTTSSKSAHLISGQSYSTDAINRITLLLSNFAENSSASLYGILKGSGGASVS